MGAFLGAAFQQRHYPAVDLRARCKIGRYVDAAGIIDR